MLDVSREDIVGGSLSRVLVLLAAPLVAQNLVQVLQQVIDTFWVGRISEEAVAAVGVNFPVLSLLFAVTLVLPGLGTQIPVSQRYGSEDEAGARRIAVHGIVVAVALALVGGAITVAFARPLLALLNPGPEVLPLAAVYLATVAIGLPVMAVSEVIEFGFIGWGDTRAALYINVAAVVVNIGLDPLFIFGFTPLGIPAMGIQGAALATVAGSIVGLLLAMAMALGLRDSFRLGWAAVSFRVSEFREVVDVGAPIVVQNMGRDVVRILIVAIVGAVGGAAALAAYTIGARVASIAYIPASGLQQAAQSVVGQNLGADQPDRARRTTWIGVAIAAGALTLVGVVQVLVPEALARVFVPDISPDALRLTVDYLLILALGYWAIGAMYSFTAGFNGASRTRVSMVANLLKYWVVRLPVAAIGAFTLGYGAYGPFWAVTISNVVAALGVGGFYYYSTHRGLFERAAKEAGTATPGD